MRPFDPWMSLICLFSWEWFVDPMKISSFLGNTKKDDMSEL
jgi:hypothetical protein